MTAILTLCLFVAGWLTIVKARNPAKIVGGVISLLVFLAVVRCLLCALVNLFQQYSGFGMGGVSLWPALGFLVLVFSGYAMWRRRDARGRMLDQARRRHGQPRKRALPPAPPLDEGHP